MKRRNFLKAASAIGLPLALNGLPVSALANTNLLGALSASNTDRVLVIIQLAGGNDGMNTVIPLDQYSTYQNLRRNVAIPENRVLRLTNATGLHPSMTAMKRLYDDGKMLLVQGVSYPSPNLSHFRATDILMSGADSNQYLESGWVGRYLETVYPGFPTGYPNTEMPDPPALQIGAVPALTLQGDNQQLGIPIQDPETFYRLVSGSVAASITDVPNTTAGDELAFIRQTTLQSIRYASQIKAAADKAQNRATYPAANSNRLADQLRIVARLIAGGLKTKVYHVSLGGFDTHAGQVVATDTTTGVHANLLAALSNAVSIFQDDLRLLGIENRVVTMTFTEFGRTIQSNASSGTDHGTSFPMFFFGTSVRRGILGVNPSLTDLERNQLKMQFDFRQIYASVLGQVFGATPTQLRAALQRDFTQVGILSTSSAESETTARPTTYDLAQNYPNPFNPSTTIRYQLPETAVVSLKVYDLLGRQVATLVNERQAAGGYTVTFNAANLSSGTYLYRLQAGNFVETKKMMLVK